jgi:hypothetical protein
MGNSPSSPSPPSPSSKSTSSSTSAPTPDKFQIPQTKEEDDSITDALNEAYQRGVADGYQQAVDSGKFLDLPECKNPDVHYEWEQVVDFPVEDWKSDVNQSGARVWGPCPGCGASISGTEARTKAVPKIDRMWVICKCRHDHGAGIGKGCGRHLSLCQEGGF